MPQKEIWNPGAARQTQKIQKAAKSSSEWNTQCAMTSGGEITKLGLEEAAAPSLQAVYSDFSPKK